MTGSNGKHLKTLVDLQKQRMTRIQINDILIIKNGTCYPINAQSLQIYIVYLSTYHIYIRIKYFI